MRQSIKKALLKSYRITKTVKNRLYELLFYRSNMERTIEELKERLNWFIEHSEITALKPATGYLRNKQLDLIDFANHFFDDISTLDLHPFLIGGNLIGAYRHHGYVPWDDDLDFGLIRSEYDTLIDYCRNHYIVEIHKGKWSEYSQDIHMARVDRLVRQHPNEYILDIWVDQLQIMRGTSCIDRLAIDFWAYDYYSDSYSIKDHMTYLKELSVKKREIDYVDKIVAFLREERSRNSMISQIPTKNIFPGIDNVEGYLRVDRTHNWLYTDGLYPLQKVSYENTSYYAPCDIENWLDYEYPDYMSYPSDAGKMPHEEYKEAFINKYLPTVEFFLIDAFEIYHFLPLYYFFEKNGIFSSFVAQPSDNNASMSWFDFNTAIEILETNGVRYKKKPNYHVDYVFTTQDEYLIDKYKGKKIHLCYGMALTSYSFCESERSIHKFDLKLVHGNCAYASVRAKSQSLDMLVIGYPRYSSWGKRIKYLYDKSEKLQIILNKNTQNKPVLLYFPTWDTASSIEMYADEFKKIKNNFFIITKAHHCTYRLDSEKTRKKILYDISDIVLEGNFSLEEAASLGNMAVCDAISGSATEVPYINSDIKLILLFSPLSEKNKYKDFIKDYAVCVENKKDLIDAIYSIKDLDPKQQSRNSLMKELYSDDCDMGLLHLKKYILDSIGGKKGENQIGKTKHKLR